MHLEEFSLKDSPIKKINTLFKVIVFLLYAFFIAFSRKWEIVVSFFVFSFVLSIFFQINFKKLLNRLLFINFFTAIIVISFAFSYGKKGFYDGMFIFIKANAIFIYTIIFIGTSSIFELAYSLKKMFLPEKLIQILIFSYRYITVLHNEYSRIMEAVKLRGFVSGSNIKTYRTYSWIFGSLVLKSYEKSKKLYEGLLCRGFDGKFYLLKEFSYNKKDFIFLILLLSFEFLVFIYFRK